MCFWYFILWKESFHVYLKIEENKGNKIVYPYTFRMQEMGCFWAKTKQRVFTKTKHKKMCPKLTKEGTSGIQISPSQVAADRKTELAAAELGAGSIVLALKYLPLLLGS